jgi:hypothetical protein
MVRGELEKAVKSGILKVWKNKRNLGKRQP